MIARGGVLLLVVAWAMTGSAAAAPLRIAIVSRTVFFVPLWIAERKNFLKQENIDATIVIYDNAEDINRDLRSGKTPIAISTPESVILDAYRGGTLRIIAGNAERLPHFIIAKPAIKSLQQLRGATFGVLSLQEGTSYMVRELAKAAGLKPSDYRIVAVGGAPARWQLLKEGKIDVGLQPFPLSYEAEAAGFTNLGPIADYVHDYLFTSVNVGDQWAKANSQTVVAFLRALRRGQDDMAANPKEAAEIAAIELSTSLPLAERALADTKRMKILSPDLSVSERALRGTFEMLKATDALPRATVFDAGRMEDLRYLALSR